MKISFNTVRSVSYEFTCSGGQSVSVALSPGLKRLESEAATTASSAKVKKIWSFTTMSPTDVSFTFHEEP
jgi:hypothetical protein